MSHLNKTAMCGHVTPEQRCSKLHVVYTCSLSLKKELRGVAILAKLLFNSNNIQLRALISATMQIKASPRLQVFTPLCDHM